MANVGKHSCSSRYILGTLQREGIEAGEPCDSESILVPHSVKTGFPCQTKHIYTSIYIAIGIYTGSKWWYIAILKYIEFGVSYFYDIYYSLTNTTNIIAKRRNKKYVSLIFNIIFIFIYRITSFKLCIQFDVQY